MLAISIFKDGEDANYRSRGYTGPRCQRDNEDPLAGEIMLSETVVTKEESPAVERLDQHSNIVTLFQLNLHPIY